MEAGSSEKGRGGTFCQFRVGTAGTSAAHLRYISRESAVRDKEEGVLLYRMPFRAINEGGKKEDRYTLLRLSLIAHAWAREAAEQPHAASGKRARRTHYRATLSFEGEVETGKALQLAEAWLRDCFPFAQAAAFLHRNSAHAHLHVWIDARGTDGKKLDFSAREYRQLDERWNALYAPFVGRSPEEHLTRKQRGRKEKKQGRARNQWREWEIKNAGRDELEKNRTGGAKPITPASTPEREERERNASGGEQALTRTLRESVRGSSEAARTVAEAQASVRETDRLRAALTRLGEREQEQKPEQQRETERELTKNKASGLER